MNSSGLPPGQREIDAMLRWNIDHPGITARNPSVNLKEWTLTVDGDVENALTLKWQEFLNLPAVESESDFHCVEGWSVKACKWYGVRFSSLAQLVKPREEAQYALFECSDGYTTSLSLEELLRDNVILAYKLNGRDLQTSMGGPLRLMVPDKYA